MDESNQHSLVEAVDELNERISKTYQCLNNDNSQPTSHLLEEDMLLYFKLTTYLLKDLGTFSPGFDMETIKGELEKTITDKFSCIETQATGLLDKFKKLMPEFTYVAASYWSPRDHKRHTAQYRSEPENDDATYKILSAAYTFYVLTFVGAKTHRLYSTTQFTVDEANKKRGGCVNYEKDNTANDFKQLWHIPSSTHEDILEKTGILALVDQIRKHFGDRNLKPELNKILENNCNGLEEEWASLTSDFFKEFSRKFESLDLMPPNLKEVVNNSIDYIRRHFGQAVSPTQALFMIATNVLYNTKVCPAKYFYAFTVNVNNTCCVMTIGTNEPLNHTQYIAASRVVSIIYTPALFADLMANEHEIGTQVDPNVRLAIFHDQDFRKVSSRQVTLCFWDIRGFTKLCNEFYGEEHSKEITEFIKEYNQKAVEIILKYNGILDKFIGDGVMAIFGITPYLENNKDEAIGVFNALSAAFDLKEAFELLTSLDKHKLVKSYIKNDHDHKFGLGCGISTGMARVGMYGCSLRRHFTALGNIVNIAARIESVAPPGHILIGEPTRLILDKYITNNYPDRIEEYYDLWEVSRSIKNVTGVVHMYNVKKRPPSQDVNKLPSGHRSG